MPFCLARSAIVLPMSCAPARLPPLTFVFSGLAPLALAPLFSASALVLFSASPLAPLSAPLAVFSEAPVFAGFSGAPVLAATVAGPLTEAVLAVSAWPAASLPTSGAALFVAAPLALSALAAASLAAALLAAASLAASVAAARKAASLDAAATKVRP